MVCQCTMQPGARVSGRIVFDGATPPPTARASAADLDLDPPAVRHDGGTAERRARQCARAVRHAGIRARALCRCRTSRRPDRSGRWRPFDSARATPPLQAVTIGAQDVGDVVITFTDKAMTLTGEVRAAEAGGTPWTRPPSCCFRRTIRLGLRRECHCAALRLHRRQRLAPINSRCPCQATIFVVAIPPEMAPEIDAEFVKRVSAARFV